MLPSFSQKFEIKRPFKNPGKGYWEEFESSFKPGPRDIPLPIWMKGTIEGTDQSERIHGTNYDETINGNSGSDVIYGHDGDDLIFGDHVGWELGADSGVDTVYGGNGKDSITSEYSYGQNGDDTLHSPMEETGYLNGGNGDDGLFGDSQNDTLIGGSGDDYLVGKGGGDEMEGGRGADTFVVGHQGSLGDLGGRPEERDIIVDFRDVGDQIQIPAIFHNNLESDEVNLAFNNEGFLIISVHNEGLSGVVAEVHGLDSQQPIEEQIDWITSATFKLVA